MRDIGPQRSKIGPNNKLSNKMPRESNNVTIPHDFELWVLVSIENIKNYPLDIISGHFGSKLGPYWPKFGPNRPQTTVKGKSTNWYLFSTFFWKAEDVFFSKFINFIAKRPILPKKVQIKAKSWLKLAIFLGKQKSPHFCIF